MKKKSTNQPTNQLNLTEEGEMIIIMMKDEFILQNSLYKLIKWILFIEKI